MYDVRMKSSIYPTRSGSVKNEALHYVLCKYILQCRTKTQKKRGKSFYNRKVTGSQIDQEMRYS